MALAQSVTFHRFGGSARKHPAPIFRRSRHVSPDDCIRNNAVVDLLVTASSLNVRVPRGLRVAQVPFVSGTNIAGRGSCSGRLGALPVLCSEHCLDALSDHFLEEFDSTNELAAVFNLFRFVQPAPTDKFCEPLNVDRQDDRVMQHDFVALIAHHR
jgi:hypothetical protein